MSITNALVTFFIHKCCDKLYIGQHCGHYTNTMENIKHFFDDAIMLHVTKESNVIRFLI